jgi:hypothetical protein
MVLATLLLQTKLGATPVQAGLSLISFSLAVIVGSYLSKPLAESVPPHRMAALGLSTSTIRLGPIQGTAVAWAAAALTAALWINRAPAR